MDQPLQQAHACLEVPTPRRGLWPCTPIVAAWLHEVGARDGVITLFLMHTSASLLVQENADPTVRADLERFFAKLVRDGDPMFEHDAEGPDDMPAHVRAALTQTQLTVPVAEGELTLGTWQGLYLYEHRLQGQLRRLSLVFQGTRGAV